MCVALHNNEQCASAQPCSPASLRALFFLRASDARQQTQVQKCASGEYVTQDVTRSEIASSNGTSREGPILMHFLLCKILLCEILLSLISAQPMDSRGACRRHGRVAVGGEGGAGAAGSSGSPHRDSRRGQDRRDGAKAKGVLARLLSPSTALPNLLTAEELHFARGAPSRGLPSLGCPFSFFLFFLEPMRFLCTREFFLLKRIFIIPSTLRPSHRLLTEEIAWVHLEHLECSHKPRTQGRELRSATQLARCSRSGCGLGLEKSPDPGGCAVAGRGPYSKHGSPRVGSVYRVSP